LEIERREGSVTVSKGSLVRPENGVHAGAGEIRKVRRRAVSEPDDRAFVEPRSGVTPVERRDAGKVEA